MIETLKWESFAPFFGPRPRDYHKGQAGHVLIIGGYAGMTGSVRLAALGAFRVGAGLVTVASHPNHAAFLNSAHPEIMCHEVLKPQELDPLFAKASVIVLGPGLSETEWGKHLWEYASQQVKPMVLDADGLNLLSQMPRQEHHWILTPHAGEAGRLLDSNSVFVQQSRQHAVEAIAKRYGGICVLKGANTLIAGPEGKTRQCPYGNPGMATAGMGDVLAGVIGGLLAQGLSLRDAAEAGVLLHAKASDKAAEEGGERGMMASDIFPYLRYFANIHP